MGYQAIRLSGCRDTQSVRWHLAPPIMFFQTQICRVGLAPPIIYLPTNASMRTLTHEVEWVFYVNRIYLKLLSYKNSFSLLISMLCCSIFLPFFSQDKHLFDWFHDSLPYRILSIKPNTTISSCPRRTIIQRIRRRS